MPFTNCPAAKLGRVFGLGIWQCYQIEFFDFLVYGRSNRQISIAYFFLTCSYTVRISGGLWTFLKLAYSSHTVKFQFFVQICNSPEQVYNNVRARYNFGIAPKWNRNHKPFGFFSVFPIILKFGHRVDHHFRWIRDDGGESGKFYFFTRGTKILRAFSLYTAKSFLRCATSVMAQNLCSRFFKLPFTTHVMPEKHANFGLARAYGAFWPLKGLALGL